MASTMASGALGGTLRYLRELFHDGTSVGLGDGQLLARYAQVRDESAFEVLVARHGPMVLATCRAILKHEQDVEDAFQATFLVLARKARSVRAGDALGGWLHRVAYRAALQTSEQSRRRRRFEAEAAEMARLETAGPAETDEIPSVVHEELDRLPDRQRLPLILCDLEGMTYDQAARHLRWTEPTLRHRLTKGRLRLRDRLIRRGFGAGAVGIALAAPTSLARAAVPATLARAAVTAAVGGSSSANVAALTTLLIRSMLMTRLKIASIGLVAAFALGTAGVVAVGAFGPDEPAPAPAMQRPVVTVTVVPTSQPPDAKPVLPPTAGPGIEGRIVDLEGRPVAGAMVEVTDLWTAPNNDLAGWLAQVQDRGVSHPLEGLSPGGMVGALLATSRGRTRFNSPSPPKQATTTDADGRFRLTGIGTEQVAGIKVTGPTIATSQLYVMGRDGADVRVTRHGGLTPSQVTYHARKLEFAAAPARPIQGVVRDKDTGRPVAGVALKAAVYDEHSLIPTDGIEATTDDRGHYRIDGLPRALAYRIFIEPGDSGPYTKGSLRAPGDAPAFEPVTFDIALKRGILVRGTVTDKVTGQPVNAGIDVYAFVDNPHVRDYPGFRSSALARSFVVDGRYEIVALPGRCLIAAVTGGYVDGYRRGVGAEAIKGYDPKNIGFNTFPHMCISSGYNVLAEVNLDPKAETAELDLQVDPGRKITAFPADPDGQRVAGTMVMGADDSSGLEQLKESTAFDIVALDPSSPRRVTVKHAERKLIGSVYLKGDEKGPVTIPLQPYGTVAGRIVDEEGRPREGVGIMSAGGSKPDRPAEQGILPGGNFGGGIRLGRDGRFRVEGLVPGLKYGATASDGFNYLGELFRDLIVAPGEVKDLGDIKTVPPKAG
jgi:RNA polymerase sigma factor (sigma-70 family)